MAEAEAEAETDNVAAWQRVLLDMEVRLDDAARVMGESTSVPRESEGHEWNVPSGIGAIPAELADRARDVLVNQRTIVGDLEKARRVTLKHLAAVRSVPPARNPGTSVYLDVSG